MNDIILIVLLVCGKPDTFIVKEPEKDPVFTHQVTNDKVMDSIMTILETKPTIIIYEDNRGICV